ncbi:hypothetical protein [uncultured Salinisphaera sp.]|uniref:hypothetical protein n=1 Tax=uncultured Salinisphaera sp. TaxID=359372 RepID=UPI0032B30715|tara:strand:- start:2335 stop:3225 length:891 start_codon:yes stop_codon:yes gene_type:complete
MPKQVRTLSVYRKLIKRSPEFRLVSPELTKDLASRIGFEEIPTSGETILPQVVGKATSFNSQGKEIVRRDLPMETYSRMIHTSWQDWHGKEHTGIQNRDYEAYPRDLIPPPEEKLTAVEKDGKLVAASRVIRRDEPEADIVVLLNLFLEIFPSFDVVAPDLAAPLQVRSVKWSILPPGEFPFDRARKELDSYLKKLPKDERAVATERIRKITRHSPDFVAVGVGGFSDYVVFGFTDQQRYVLESPHTGNATYVFRDDWEQISGYTKREILQGGLQEERLIHNKRWSRAIGELIDRP